MKKVLFALSVIGLTAMVSCKKDESKVEEVTTTEVNSPTEEAPVVEQTTETTVAVPKFSNDEVQKLANEYADYYAQVLAATKAGDATKIKELQTKGAEWATKTQALAAKMTPDDAKKWAEFAQALATAQTGK